MNTQDDQLKRMIRDEEHPSLTPEFEDRALARVHMPGPQKNWLNLHAWAGQSRHVDKFNSSRPFFLLGFLLALTLVTLGVHHMVQRHSDEELNRLDAVGMSSLLTL
jgi:hypothetical protein